MGQAGKISREAAARLHETYFLALLTQYGLRAPKHAQFVSTVYADEYPLVKDLPLWDALEHICRVAAFELKQWAPSPPT